jgi:hypothetical protein
MSEDTDYSSFEGAGSLPAQQAAFREARTVVRPKPVDPNAAEADLIRRSTHSTLANWKRQRELRPQRDPMMDMVASGYHHAAMVHVGEPDPSPFTDPDAFVNGERYTA